MTATKPPTFRKRLLKALLCIVGIPALLLLIVGILYVYAIHRTNGEILTSGKTRNYLLYIPKSYQPGRPTPLVISLHGFGEWPEHLKKLSHWNDLADEFGFIVVYPAGSKIPPRWYSNNFPNDTAKAQQDVQFISDLIDQLAKTYTIDTNRVYANGLSNGGGMSFLLACNLSERIAAIGGVSGAYILPWSKYTPKRPVPMILFHGTSDPIVPFHGGPSGPFKVAFPNITNWVQTLAASNGCNPTPLPLPATGNVSGLRYTGTADVVFYKIEGGGHTWPGGKEMPAFIVGKTTHDIDATRLMWDFFQQHPMPK